MSETRPIIGGAGVGGPVRARTLIFLRWVAIAGQLSALVIAQVGLGVSLPMDAALAAIVASVIVNLASAWGSSSASRLTDNEAALYLGYDLIQLTGLLHLTGGLTNPFALLALAPVTISATVLSRRSTAFLFGLVIISVTILALWRRPLAWVGGGIALPLEYEIGIWAALVVGATFMTVYASSVAEEARRMSDALAATHMALAREQRLSALGALAAAAAHELGSPLATIAVVAKDLARDLPADSFLAEDAALLLSQTERCRDILARLAARPEPGERSPFSNLPIGALVEESAAPHRGGRIQIEFRKGPSAGRESREAEPVVERSPEVLHGLGSLIENAVQFASGRVTIRAEWGRGIAVVIADDGPGFDPVVLDRIGEPYISSRGEEGMHMGLGIFIAKNLLERTGATVTFGNRADGGAEATVRWPRAEVMSRPEDTP